MGDGLNAGAATFTPGAPAAAAEQPPPEEGTRRASAMSDDSMLDEIEAELKNQGLQGSSSNMLSMGAGAYPDLPPHADEFWFPECRDCACCNGYKHGCQCCAKQGMRQCKCVGPSCTPAPPQQQQPPPAQGGWMPAAPGPGSGNYNPGGRGGPNHYGGRGRGGGRGGRGPPPKCRFFFTNTGCRFGDNCRFSHVG